MQTLSVQATMTKQVITQHDKHLLCLAIIKQIMLMQVKESTYVPQVSRQRQDTSTAYTGIASLERSDFLTQQKALV
jgi:hypothetical protein